MIRYKFIWKNLKGKRFAFILGLVLSAITSVIVIINPYLTKILVDDVIRGNRRDLLVPLLIGMCLIVFVKTCLFMWKVVLMERSSQSMLMSIRKSIFHNLQHQEMSFFDKNRSGDLITRVTGDLEYMRHFVAWVVYVLLETVVTFLAAVVILSCVNVTLTLALMSVLPFIIVGSVIYSRKVRPIYRGLRNRLSDLNVAASENIAGNRVVRAFAREDHEREKFAKVSETYKKENLRASYAWQSIVPVIDFFGQFLTFITLLVGGLLVIREEISIGDLTMFTGLTWALSNPMKQICNLLNDVQRFNASTDKVMEVYYAKPLICDRVGALDTKERLKGKIEFRNVSFRYGDEPVLDHVSFTINPYETVAIIGPTGGGKTTLASLIARFYDPTEGEIFIDNVDIRYRTLSSIHTAVAIATQDVFLFSDTIAGNISFCSPDMEDEQIYECARLACADGFIRKLPEGYDTIVGERGVGLSGGQRQRIALARAIAAIPSILILDDTTSAVDLETEKHMQYNLHNLPFHCTTLIIAQRISSVKNADKIIVLENGRVTVGTHDTLMRKNRYYRDVCTLQDVKDIPEFEGGE
ncbi:MAG: ABC transporter ATP-binding protein [Clostridia bacterium]|nr:ABC transporter ATP-binding protein [Clostridia bacterium]